MHSCYLLVTILVLYSIGSFHASFVTKYTRMSPSGSFDIALCMDIPDDTNVCGLRLTNTTCEQLDTSWCESNPVMLNGYTYLKKSEKTEFPEAINVTHFDRFFPINYTMGSEVEIKFTKRVGCTGYRINFQDDVGNFVFHVSIGPNEFYSSSKTAGIGWDGHYGNKLPNIYNTEFDVQYTLKIVRSISGFLVYMNGVEEWEHPYEPKYSPQNITLFDSKFKQAPGDVYQLTFRSG